MHQKLSTEHYLGHTVLPKLVLSFPELTKYVKEETVKPMRKSPPTQSTSFAKFSSPLLISYFPFTPCPPPTSPSKPGGYDHHTPFIHDLGVLLCWYSLMLDTKKFHWTPLLMSLSAIRVSNEVSPEISPRRSSISVFPWTWCSNNSIIKPPISLILLLMQFNQ